ncbi:MAG: alpha/beta hydrolase [Cyclobacteriaceae bacterium]
MRLNLFIVFLSSILSLTAARIDTLVVRSGSMDKSIRNIVILPESYANNKSEFPVVYLLHGAYGDFTDWTSKVSSIQTIVDEYNFIVVCPDGGGTSWYFDSPIDSLMRYETYVSEELVSSVDENYNTSVNRRGRAITGLSMGGHGAFYLALRHQDIWGAAGSMSGGLDIRPFPNNWDLLRRLGTYAENERNWEENAVINMVHKLNGKLKLIFDCGTEDFFIDVNRRFHQKLLERNIPHEYTERPGEHNWEYWSNAIEYQMLFFHNYFND